METASVASKSLQLNQGPLAVRKQAPFTLIESEKRTERGNANSDSVIKMLLLSATVNTEERPFHSCAMHRFIRMFDFCSKMQLKTHFKIVFHLTQIRK